MVIQNTIYKYLTIFFISRTLFFIYALLAPFFITLRGGYLGSNQNPESHFWLWAWANFDGQHYLNIAISGYQGFNFAFFPLYPLLISSIHRLIPVPQLYLGILISSASLLGSMVFIYKIARLDFDQRIANLSLILLLFFPLAFFYNSVYADSLFLFLSTLSFYLARRKKWFLAGIIGSLAAFTRLSGLSLIPALFLEWYLQNKDVSKKVLLSLFLKQAVIPLALIGTGFITYLLYLQLNHGDWLLFQKSMIAWRQNNFVFPLQIIFRYIKIFLSVDIRLFEYWVAVLELTSVLTYLALAVYVWKKIRPSYGLFMIVLLTLVSFTGTLGGSPRYTLHLFPGFLGLSLLASKNKAFKIGLILLFLILSLLLSALFTRGYFVA